MLLTTDRRLQYQQNLKNRKISTVVLTGTTKWSQVRLHLDRIAAAVDACGAGDYVEVDIPFPTKSPSLNSIDCFGMYELHSLGWHSFQLLCLTVVREILGQTVESLLDTADGGRDGAFIGVWKQQKAEALTGKFVIQCKFTGKQGKNLQVSEISGRS